MDSDANYSAQAGAMYVEILDALIVDVAAEVHRAAKLGFDQRMNVDEEEELRLSVQARASASAGENGEAVNGGGSKYVVDVFGQSHPAVASELFDCMNCGRPIMAGRFAPHLEKCMGKGRKARLKSTRSSQQQQQQQQQRKPRSMYVEDDE